MNRYSTLAWALVCVSCAASPVPSTETPTKATSASASSGTGSASTPHDAARETAGPPVAAIREAKDTYFGTAVVDPYRWMEETDSAELATWMKAQAEFTRARLDALPTRSALLTRVRELDHAGDRVFGVESWGGRYFYRKRAEGHDLPKLVVRDSLTAPERVLFDPEAMQKDGTHFAIDFATPSRDGKLVAYGVSPHGSEDSVLHVVDAATGKVLPDAIDRAQFGGVAWIDAKSFFYTRLQKLAPGAAPTEKYKRATAYRHVLGDDPDKDTPVLGAGVNDAVPVKDTEIGIGLAPAGSRYVFAIPGDGVRREAPLYYAPRAALAGAKTPWKKVYDVADDVTAFDVHGEDLYVLTHHDAPRFKLLKMSLAKPDFAKATVVVPESDLVITGFAAARDALYLKVLDAGIGRIRRLPYALGAKVETVPLPVEGSLDDPFSSPTSDGFIVEASAWTVSARILAYDPKTKQVTDTKLVPPSPVSFDKVTSEEVRVKSGDVMVPLSIVHSKDFAKDGSHPTWLEGYGAYGITLDPYFSPTRLAWYERGGIFAVCHVRGGGELGEGWHKDGMLLNKQHSIDDMIACGQWLIDNGYTRTSKLAGEGTSAGGILIGGAITQRPEMFGAALVRVGVSNVLRFEQTLNVLNVPEFGSASTEDGFKALYASDAYGHVKNGTKYPAVLLTTGATDPRVAPWQVTKMAARLQAATVSGKPVLLRVDYDAGHGMGSTVAQRDDELADEFAFLLWQLGER